MATNTMKITYQGPDKCYLAYDTLSKCDCITCTFFKQYECSRFIDDNEQTYAVIPMDETEKVLDYQICPAHHLRMNLISWADREAARSADMDLIVTGTQRGTKWADTVTVEGKTCKLAVEIL